MEAVLALIACCVVLAGAQQNGDLKLVGSSSLSGRVEIYLDGTWGTIDAGTYSSDQKGPAQTICRQLGFKNSADYGTVGELGFDPAADNVPMAIEDVWCPYKAVAGNARQHILRCSYNPGTSNPDHQRDFAVKCKNSDSTVFPYDTQVRLVQGDTGYSSSGFVQVYLRGSWGPVCNMKLNDANTACRQLGYTEASDYGDSDIYDQGGSDKIDTFYCYDSESCLRSCYNYGDTFISCYSYSYVNCTFDVNDEYLYGSGDETTCSWKSIVALAVGVFIAVLVFIVLVIIACVVVCCCCIPGCILHSTRRRVVYQTI